MICPCCGSELKCPSCGGLLKDGATNVFCSNYKNGCKFHVPYFVYGKKLTDNQIIMLINQQQTSVIKGMTSKSGKKFDAAIKIDKKTGKLSLEFPNQRE